MRTWILSVTKELVVHDYQQRRAYQQAESRDWRRQCQQGQEPTRATRRATTTWRLLIKKRRRSHRRFGMRLRDRPSLYLHMDFDVGLHTSEPIPQLAWHAMPPARLNRPTVKVASRFARDGILVWTPSLLAGKSTPSPAMEARWLRYSHPTFLQWRRTLRRKYTLSRLIEASSPGGQCHAQAVWQSSFLWLGLMRLSLCFRLRTPWQSVKLRASSTRGGGGFG